MRGRGRSRQLLLVHRGLRADWSLPKGKLDAGEFSCVAAVRETREETGLQVWLGPRLPALSYRALGQPKVVEYWLGQLADTAIASGDVDLPTGWQPNDEVDEVRWVSLRQAAQLLTYPHDVGIVKSASQLPSATSPLIILRHAKAEKRAAFAARSRGVIVNDHDRPLTPEGESATPMIAQALLAYGVTSYHSSPARRCFDTLSPYSAAPHQVTKEPALSEQGFVANPGTTVARSRELALRPEALVVCSHRPVIPSMIEAIAQISTSQRPAAALKPGEFVVFHRPLNRSRRIEVGRAFQAEHCSHSLFSE